ncbi:hypothetical protein C6N75_07055 [Streptomyces solincola]|uniref:PucR C-terminal helix-turn-helix domain-containing protein n=1 Tax=Streptomyces solincola TaxID=2100817 RepID=A0A2S9PZZ2_9ACTN|nr:helix-turn-helix domain-containing protein [Streptomyces solincola]PRH79913.1 hypothetical protein C6N75_07055 [Streptomyces solincola]
MLDTDAVRAWPPNWSAVWSSQQRIALRCWLLHGGKTALAAAELHLHRTTLTTWLGQCAQALGHSLADAAVRADLHLALDVTQTPSHDPQAPPPPRRPHLPHLRRRSAAQRRRAAPARAVTKARVGSVRASG